MKEFSSMSYQHMNINQLTNIESNDYLRVNDREGARRINIGKNKVYRYYRLFKQGLTVEEIYSTYKQNKHRCVRINDCKTIQERDEQSPTSSTNQKDRHFEGDTPIGKNRHSASVTLVEKKSKYIVLLKPSHKSQEVKDATLN